MNGRNNQDSTDSDQLSRRHQASTSSSLKHSTSICEIDLEFDKDAIHEAESTPGVYYNNSVALQRPKVSVDGLVEFVDSLTQDDIKVAFEKFPQGLIKPYVHSQRSGNLQRNRYKGIYPYDDCRVKIRGEDTDYINASFIDGYKKRKEYIATLGPMSYQLGGEFEPFWRMVWQQKVEKIVMVTNLIENGTG
ncbi:receptor-type tyrosine-protein phosphatase alpha-like [Mya arenaria]|uniref:receptor-type tyrosine-protein phosphatase alpha-like n=1 Tax=Mya arenaria TaxID=6604 RepID=UPI0022E91C74|nr:receptor-type tyrosine-protein phosphatase alpha-like [Mya arenaria]